VLLDMFAALAGSTQALAASGRVLFVVRRRHRCGSRLVAVEDV